MVRNMFNRYKSNKAVSSHCPTWSTAPLEPRLLLAADAGVEISEAIAGSDVAPTTAAQESVNLVFIDPTVDNFDQIISGMNEGHELVLLNGDQSGLEQISRALSTRTGVSSVHLIAHGEAGQIRLGSDVVSEATLVEQQNQIRGWRSSLTQEADILLYSCNTAADEVGARFIKRLAGLTGADVAASDDTTGSTELGGDWVLEHSIGAIESGLAISQSTRNQYRSTLPITIRAAGSTGQEEMQLLIDGEVVRTFTNIGGDPDAREFQNYTYNANGVTADRIRIAFTNDLFDEAAGIDRNLTINNILVDGLAYQTEASSVFSTGTWLPDDGVTPGFGRGETLHSNGYFQFASSDTTQIDIRARGETGQESMSLQVDGVTVRTWNNIGTSDAFYTHNVAGNVTADQIRVTFNNDFFDEATNTDRNLIVNFIRVNEQAFQTEDASVFSTGTWTPADGIVPGFGRGETLHSDGYFQYAGGGNSGGSDSLIRVFANGFEGDENIELQIDGVAVQQWNNIGTSQQVFSYDPGSVVDPDQVRIAFTNDLLDEATGVDRNVLVDRIEIGSNAYQTETEDVFSTGTWTPADGIAPGFGRGDILHTDGYFQYGGGSGSESGSFALATSIINVNESEGVALVTVNRTGGSGGLATIQYRTVSGSAVDGSDFTGVDDVLTFQPGVTSRTVAIPIINDSNSEGTENFSFTIDNPTGAGLLVPRTATITINDIALPNFNDFASVNGLALNGSASQSGDVLQLTDQAGFVSGTAYYETAIPVNSNTSFQSNFAFRITGGAGGADGFTFHVQNSPEGTSALGPIGGYFGYQGTTNSLAIEFDTYANGWDVNDNHVSVIVNGNAENAIITRAYDFDFNDGATRYAWVDYNGTNNVLAVYISETNQKPGSPVLVTNVDLSSLVGNQMYAGFSAGTGGFTNNHEIVSWTMNTEVPPIPNDPPPGDTLTTTTIASGFAAPTAIDFTADGSVMFVAEQRGIVTAYQNGSRVGTVLDFTDRVNGTRDRGLLDIAVHPDLANNPYLYLLYTYDPPEVFGQPGGSLAGPDGNGNRAGRLTRVTLDASTGYTTIVDNSEVILIGSNSTWNNFNAFANSTSNFSEAPAGILPDGSNLQDFIATDSESHTIGSVEFGPDGALYVSVGDGTSYNQLDVRTLRVQDLDNLSGKILRVDPITGQGLSDNPFYTGDPNQNQSKVYQYGVRNPFRITVDDATGQVYVGDVGWTTWEEINAGGAGANFGWPFYEGSSGANAPTRDYQNLPEASAFYANNNAVPSLLALNHAADGINAIVLGDVYNGNQYPAEYQGDLFFNDLGQGIVRNISFNPDGSVAGVQTFATGANVVVQMVVAPDGFMYFVDLDGGFVGRWEFV